MANETYPYAYDDTGKIVYIKEINQDNRHDSHYHCYGCDKELFPVLGDARKHHFRHEKDSECDPNRHLHEYAKQVIKKRFDENDTFIIKYHAHKVCKYIENCLLKEKINCKDYESDGLYEVDLKKYYDTCVLERGYYEETIDGKKRYVADLKITNSKEDKPPVTIEVWVTHKCTEDKLQSGAKIIEIKVSEEKDAWRNLEEKVDDVLEIGFYGFKKMSK